MGTTFFVSSRFGWDFGDAKMRQFRNRKIEKSALDSRSESHTLYTTEVLKRPPKN